MTTPEEHPGWAALPPMRVRVSIDFTVDYRAAEAAFVLGSIHQGLRTALGLGDRPELALPTADSEEGRLREMLLHFAFSTPLHVETQSLQVEILPESAGIAPAAPAPSL